MNLQDVLQGPLITEKGTMLSEGSNQVIFRVHPEANKVEIQHAVQHFFKVTVMKVRTSVRLGKVRRVGKNFGRRSTWKKAYVTLADGNRIEFFEGA